MTSIKDDFENAVTTIKTSEANFKPSNELKLTLYGLYKQATQGDINIKQPGILDAVGRAKYKAWAACKGLDAEKAMRSYVETFNQAKAKNHR